MAHSYKLRTGKVIVPGDRQELSAVEHEEIQRLIEEPKPTPGPYPEINHEAFTTVNADFPVTIIVPPLPLNDDYIFTPEGLENSV